MYDLEKDYLTRTLPEQQKIKNFSEEIAKNNLNQAIKKSRMKDLIEFQQKLSSSFGEKHLDINNNDENEAFTTNDDNISPFDYREVKTKKRGEVSQSHRAALLEKIKGMPRFKENEDIRLDFTKEKPKFDVSKYMKGFEGESVSYIGDSIGKENQAKADNFLEKHKDEDEQAAELFDKFSAFLRKNHLKLQKEESETTQNIPKQAEIPIPPVKASKTPESKLSTAFLQAQSDKIQQDIPSNYIPSIPTPPSSFLSIEELANKESFDFFTQRKQRRSSRFPDPQWDCAAKQIGRLLKFLCVEEVATSYQCYCKVLFAQFNSVVESFLYNDNDLSICQNIHMCPISE